MSKPMTLSEKLNRWADAADDECRVDEADLFREADAALAAKDAEIAKLRRELKVFVDFQEEIMEVIPSSLKRTMEYAFSTSSAALKEKADA